MMHGVTLAVGTRLVQVVVVDEYGFLQAQVLRFRKGAEHLEGPIGRTVSLEESGLQRNQIADLPGILAGQRYIRQRAVTLVSHGFKISLGHGQTGILCPRWIGVDGGGDAQLRWPLTTA